MSLNAWNALAIILLLATTYSDARPQSSRSGPAGMIIRMQSCFISSGPSLPRARTVAGSAGCLCPANELLVRAGLSVQRAPASVLGPAFPGFRIQSLRSSRAGRGPRLVLRMTKTEPSPMEDAKEAVCNAVRSAQAALGMEVQDKAKDSSKDASKDDQDAFLAEVSKEVTTWVKQVQQIEDANIAELRSSLDAVYEQLNLGSSLQWSRQSKAADRAVTWRAIRRKTDPATKNLLIAIERIRRRYDKGMFAITDKVRPWTDEEILDGVQAVTDSLTGKKNSLSSITGDFESTADTITEAIKPFSNEEVEAFTSEIDVRWKYGLQVAEEDLRAGVERARYHIWRRAKRRTVEAGAASLSWRDGAIHATSFDGKVSVPILEGVGAGIYVDDLDDVHMFVGMSQKEDLAQHVVRLGTLPATMGRWLSCARQKLWWMSPDVGARLDALPAESQFVLYDAGQGMYVVMLPLVGNTFRSALWGAENGAIDLHVESGDPNVKCKVCATSVLMAAGTDPYVLLERAFAAAAGRNPQKSARRRMAARHLRRSCRAPLSLRLPPRT